VRARHGGGYRKAVAGFANSRGGFLIIGADRAEESVWHLNGVSFANDEPGVWIDSIIRDGLAPIPDHDVQVFKVSDARTAVVVRVEPATLPPCLTRDGVVYQRVSGRTIPVTDPAILAALVEHGREAENQARKNAGQVVDDLKQAGWGGASGLWLVALGLCAAAYEPGIRQRLFNADMKEKLSAVVAANLRPDRRPAAYRGARVRVRQQELLGIAAQREKRQWCVMANLDGAVAVACLAPDTELGIELFFEDIFEPAWRSAAQLVRELGGSDRTRVWIEIVGEVRFAYREAHAPLTEGYAFIPLWTDAPEPELDDYESVKRELLRAAGFEAWEP
jgi:hypothetical protein